MLYFAYGSNMSTPRLRARIGSAAPVAVGWLEGHRLAFHKVSRLDRSGKCDACFTGDPRDRVWGVVFEVTEADLIRLDRWEGRAYRRQTVSVRTAQAHPLTVHTYIALETDPALKPLHWYKEHVLRGAREHRLPPEYIRFIEQFEAMVDPDAERAAREQGLYNG